MITDDLMQFLAPYNPKLENDGDSNRIIVKNPYNLDQMYDLVIEVDENSEEFIPMFGTWHSHYEFSEDSYCSMIEDIEGIFKSELAAITLFDSLHSMHSGTLHSPSFIPRTSPYDALKFMLHFCDDEYIKAFVAKGGYYSIIFWDSSKNEFLHLRDGQVISAKSAEI